MNPLTRQCRTLLLAATVGAFFSVGAIAQGDTAYVPFVVNAKGSVKAAFVSEGARGDVQIQKELSVWANEVDTLKLPLQKTTGIVYNAHSRTNAPAVIRANGGKITLNLPAQSYKNAEISLYSVNGRKVMRRNINSENSMNNIQLGNIATGTYLLSIRGDGSALATSRLTHSGGSLNIDVTLGGEARSPAAPRQAKSNATGEVWTIKITAAGYEDSSYSLAVLSGINARQTIILRTSYEGVKIGPYTWMAKNSSVVTSVGKSWCSDGTSNCEKYGRHYDWDAAQEACPTGWRLPTRLEWDRLARFAGGELVTKNTDHGEWHTWLNAGKNLKAKSGWKDNNGTDSLGFSALPGGKYDLYANTFLDQRAKGSWWTSTEYDTYMSYAKEMNSEDNDLEEMLVSTWMGCSVRCIQK